MNDVIWVSIIGAGLVFLGLLFLWFLMDLLVRLTSAKPEQEPESREGQSGVSIQDVDLDYKKKAAAASIAVAIALLNTSFLPSRKKVDQRLSAWQITYRNRQLQNRLDSTSSSRKSK